MNQKNQKKIRKTIPFHIYNDAFILDHINERVVAGEDFSAVVKQLLTMIITLLTFFPALKNFMTSDGGMTLCHTLCMTEDSDFLDPFADLMK